MVKLIKNRAFLKNTLTAKNRKEIASQLRRKLAQLISTSLIALFIFAFSAEGFIPMGDPWRIYWTLGFLLGRYLVFQSIKFGFPPKFADLEKKYVRKSDHRHTWRCLMGPEVPVFFFLPFINPALLWRGVLFVLIDVYSCVFGTLFGKHLYFENKTVEGSLGAFACIFLTFWIFIPVSPWILLAMSALGVVVEAFSPKLGLKDNFFLSLVGILSLIFVSWCFGIFETFIF